MVRETAGRLDSGRVGCRTCEVEALVPEEAAASMLVDFFAEHGPPCSTWIDVPALKLPPPVASGG